MSLFNKFISEPSLKKVLLANKGKDVIINVMNKHSNHKLIQFYGAQLLNNIVKKKEIEQNDQRTIDDTDEITISKMKNIISGIDYKYDDYKRILYLKIDQADNDGRTPLYLASVKDHKEIVRMLIDAGADVNKANKYGSAPLYWASVKDHKEIVKMLREAGAKEKK